MWTRKKLQGLSRFGPSFPDRNRFALGGTIQQVCTHDRDKRFLTSTFSSWPGWFRVQREADWTGDGMRTLLTLHIPFQSMMSFVWLVPTYQNMRPAETYYWQWALVESRNDSFIANDREGWRSEFVWKRQFFKDCAEDLTLPTLICGEV